MNQEDIYNYLKRDKGSKFSVVHLTEIFNCNRKTMEAYLTRMIKNNQNFPGFSREESIQRNKVGVRYVCNLYFVEGK